MSQKGPKIDTDQHFPLKKGEKPLSFRDKDRPPRILVAPLDWGLGHATRCIPLVREFLKQQADIWLAGEGAQEQLLRQEFPGLPFLRLPGYRVRYARSAQGLTWSMIRQAPRLRQVIRDEHKWLRNAVTEHGFDAVISDNRFGLHHPQIPCIFITHQLQIKSSAGKWTERWLQQRNYRYINRFTECWVPDSAGSDSLSGELSHPVRLPAIPVRYIGPLSRFRFQEQLEKKGHLLCLLSGPEPQRSLLEELIIRDISHYPGTATIIRGLPGAKTQLPSTGMIRFYNHLDSETLNQEIREAGFIISRSGYSTIMDMAALQKKCIFIPTPGQTEQEYLGRYQMEKSRALSLSQKDFTLSKSLEAAHHFPYQPFPVNEKGSLAAVVEAWLAQLIVPT